MSVYGWNTGTVNVQRYLKLLFEKIVSYLRETDMLSYVTFMQDGTISHTAIPIKAFPIQMSCEGKILSKRFIFPWPLRSPDLTSADLWLWIYLKSGMYRSGSSNLSEITSSVFKMWSTETCHECIRTCCTLLLLNLLLVCSVVSLVVVYCFY